MILAFGVPVLTQPLSPQQMRAQDHSSFPSSARQKPLEKRLRGSSLRSQIDPQRFEEQRKLIRAHYSVSKQQFASTGGVDTAWVRNFGGGLPGWIAGYQTTKLVVDGSGNGYVTFASYDSTTETDWTTIKFNPKGDTVWMRQYDDGFYEIPGSIAIDGNGNVYIAGICYGDMHIGSLTYGIYTIIKYNPSGDILWMRSYNNTAEYGGTAEYCGPISIAVDGSENVYITGSIEDMSGSDCITIKYNSFGDPMWVIRFNEKNGGFNFIPTSINVEISGNVYVAGSTLIYGKPIIDYATIKYNPNGDTIWVRRYNGPENEEDYIRSLALDGSGNMYITGSSGFIPDYATIKYNSTGDTMWVRRYDGHGYSRDVANSLVVDKSGNVYIAGTSGTIKYSADGTQQWIGTYGGIDMAIDTIGNVYVTSSDSTGIVTVRYNSSGNAEWIARYSTIDSSSTYPEGIEIDDVGNVYVVGKSRRQYANTLIKYVQITTSVNKDESRIPSSFSLLQNYPNPFNPATVISFELPVTSNVSLKIYDLLGREVADLVNEIRSAGSYKAQWNAANMPSGVYFYRLQAGEYVETKKLVLMK